MESKGGERDNFELKERERLKKYVKKNCNVQDSIP